MIKIICDRCGRETYMKNPDLTGRAKIGFEEYDLCKYCILDIKRFINQGRAEQTEPSFKVDEVGDDDPTIHAIAYLQKVGWLQEHDRALTEQTEPMVYPQVDGITPSVIQTEPCDGERRE